MEEIDLKEIFKTLWDNKLIIAVITMLIVIVTAIYSFFLQKPKYQSSTTLVLTKSESGTAETNSNTTSVTSTDITINQNLVSTYAEIIKSDSVLSQVISNLEMQDELTEGTLKKNIDVEAITDTEVIEITVTNDEPEKAAIIANEIANVFSDKISEMYEMNNVYILDEAKEATVPYNINHVKYIIIAFGIGIILSCAFIIIRSLFDTTVKSSSDIEEKINAPVIAQIDFYEDIDINEGGEKDAK